MDNPSSSEIKKKSETNECFAIPNSKTDVVSTLVTSFPEGRTSQNDNSPFGHKIKRKLLDENRKLFLTYKVKS